MANAILLGRISSGRQATACQNHLQTGQRAARVAPRQAGVPTTSAARFAASLRCSRATGIAPFSGLDRRRAGRPRQTVEVAALEKAWMGQTKLRRCRVAAIV
jgi:hypothetical protein